MCSCNRWDVGLMLLLSQNREVIFAMGLYGCQGMWNRIQCYGKDMEEQLVLRIIWGSVFLGVK